MPLQKCLASMGLQDTNMHVQALLGQLLPAERAAAAAAHAATASKPGTIADKSSALLQKLLHSRMQPAHASLIDPKSNQTKNLHV